MNEQFLEPALKMSARYIKSLTAFPDADDRISLYLQSLLSSFRPAKDSFSAQSDDAKSSTEPAYLTTIHYFTVKEIAKMDKTFKKVFIANGLAAHIMRIKRYKTTISYCIRYRRCGYSICVSASTIEKVKAKFLEATRPENIENYKKKHIKSPNNTVRSVATEWLKTKEKNIDPRTLRDYQMNCNLRIFPKIGDLRISRVRTSDITEIIDAEKGRVTETLFTIFKGIMLYAMANGDITYNPMLAVKFKKAARTNRRALSPQEEQTFFERIDLPEFEHYKPFFLLQYYFGLRPWELTDFHFENDFIVALNAKHEHNGEKVYKKIPVPSQLKARLDLSQSIEYNHKTDVLNRVFKRLMNDNTVTQYFLRHTFSTICQQYVRPDIVKIWMGDSPESLVGRVYTHFPDDFMRKQMDLVKFFA